jgi:hypothetical protein
MRDKKYVQETLQANTATSIRVVKPKPHPPFESSCLVHQLDAFMMPEAAV